MVGLHSQGTREGVAFTCVGQLHAARCNVVLESTQYDCRVAAHESPDAVWLLLILFRFYALSFGGGACSPQ